MALADDRAVTESIRAALPKTDLLLAERTVEDGLRRTISVEADLVLLDDAPRFGLGALKTLQDAMGGLPVIVLASRGDADTEASYLSAGATRCIVKPFSCGELLRAISDCARPQTPSLASSGAAPLSAPSDFTAQYRAALNWMNRATARCDDYERLAESLVDTLTDVFDTECAGVLLKSQGSVSVVAQHGMHPGVAKTLRLTYREGLMRRFEARPSAVQLGESAQTDREMAILGARLAAPIVGHGRVCGAIFVGEKFSGLGYSHEERELVSLLARSAAVCLMQVKERKQQSRQQNRLDAVLSAIPTGVVTVRPDRTVSMMNQSAEGILRLRADRVLGQSIQKLGSPFADLVLRCLADGAPLLRREIYDAATKTTLGLSVSPLGSEGAVALFTALPAAASEDERVASSPVWEFLASRMAQEIKNPMVAINTFAQLLPEKYGSVEFRVEFGQVVQKEVARINGVVETLFEFARQRRLHFQRTELNQNVKTVLESFREEFENHLIEVETDYDPESLEVKLDPILFARALHNVVQNSIEAMPEGGTLHIATRRENGSCNLVVRDSGPGVNPNDVSNIFMPFFSTKENGMGLGLTLADRIVNLHDGQLELTGTADGGGEFRFSLPAAGEAA